MSATDVDEYLSGVEEPQRTTLQTVRRRLLVELPDAEEAIFYGVPAFRVSGVGVAGYAPAKRHCSYFPMSGNVLVAIVDSLSGYEWSKGTLRFPIDEPLPQDLISRLVRARLSEIGQKQG